MARAIETLRAVCHAIGVAAARNTESSAVWYLGCMSNEQIDQEV